MDIRAKVDAMYEQLGEFVDSRFPNQIQSDFHSASWELYLAEVLHRNNLQLVEWKNRPTKSAGADFLTEDGLWIEATVARDGEGDDAVPQPPKNIVYTVPEDLIILRLSNSIQKKHHQHCKWLEQGIIKQNQPYCIAINGRQIKSNISEHDDSAPKIVKTVFPLGGLQVEWNLETAEVIVSKYEYKDSISKSSGASVEKRYFMDEAYSGISAILYSYEDIVNPPLIGEAGNSMIVIHNPLAQNPISDEVFSFANQFRAYKTKGSWTISKIEA
jgi:hypothetical protein